MDQREVSQDEAATSHRERTTPTTEQSSEPKRANSTRKEKLNYIDSLIRKADEHNSAGETDEALSVLIRVESLLNTLVVGERNPLWSRFSYALDMAFFNKFRLHIPTEDSKYKEGACRHLRLLGILPANFLHEKHIAKLESAAIGCGRNLFSDRVLTVESEAVAKRFTEVLQQAERLYDEFGLLLSDWHRKKLVISWSNAAWGILGEVTTALDEGRCSEAFEQLFHRVLVKADLVSIQEVAPDTWKRLKAILARTLRELFKLMSERSESISQETLFKIEWLLYEARQYGLLNEPDLSQFDKAFERLVLAGKPLNEQSKFSRFSFMPFAEPVSGCTVAAEVSWTESVSLQALMDQIDQYMFENRFGFALAAVTGILQSSDGNLSPTVRERLYNQLLYSAQPYLFDLTVAAINPDHSSLVRSCFDPLQQALGHYHLVLELPHRRLWDWFVLTLSESSEPPWLSELEAASSEADYAQVLMILQEASFDPLTTSLTEDMLQRVSAVLRKAIASLAAQASEALDADDGELSSVDAQLRILLSLEHYQQPAGGFSAATLQKRRTDQQDALDQLQSLESLIEAEQWPAAHQMALELRSAVPAVYHDRFQQLVNRMLTQLLSSVYQVISGQQPGVEMGAVKQLLDYARDFLEQAADELKGKLDEYTRQYTRAFEVFGWLSYASVASHQVYFAEEWPEAITNILSESLSLSITEGRIPGSLWSVLIQELEDYMRQLLGFLQDSLAEWALGGARRFADLADSVLQSWPQLEAAFKEQLAELRKALLAAEKKQQKYHLLLAELSLLKRGVRQTSSDIYGYVVLLRQLSRKFPRELIQVEQALFEEQVTDDDQKLLLTTELRQKSGDKKAWFEIIEHFVELSLWYKRYGFLSEAVFSDIFSSVQAELENSFFKHFQLSSVRSVDETRSGVEIISTFSVYISSHPYAAYFLAGLLVRSGYQQAALEVYRQIVKSTRIPWLINEANKEIERLEGPKD